MASSRSQAYAKRRRLAQRRKQQQDQLQVESLEPRVLLAGNTSTEVAQIVSVVPQPIIRSGSTLTQARNQVDVYFNDVDLIDSSASAENTALYQLIYTNDTITNTDDTIINPVAVNYNPSLNKAVLTFSNNLSALGGESPFRLRINTQELLPTEPIEVLESSIYDAGLGLEVPTDAGSSFVTAASITGATIPGDRLTSAVTIDGTIEAKAYGLAFPGDDQEPGMRDLPLQPHYLIEPIDVDGIQAIPYNFQSLYGYDPSGNPLRNAITANQKARAREVFEIYSTTFGLTFYETEDQGITIATGDVRALGGDTELTVSGLAGPAGETPTTILDLQEPWNDTFGGTYTKAVMREVARLIGLGVTPEAAGSSVTGNIGESFFESPSYLIGENGADTLLDTTQFGIETERIYPGEATTILGQHLYRPESSDFDLYRFQLSDGGTFSAETIAERLADSSLLDTALTLYKRVGGEYELVARNDDYFSEDSLIHMELESGTYIIGVSASGNTNYDPTIEDTGLNGTSEGPYRLRLDFSPRSTQNLLSRSGAALDGDGDGVAGGVFNFWFEANTSTRTIYVDKSYTGASDGSLSAPYSDIDVALSNAVGVRDIVRIVGNGGADGDLSTVGDNLAYELGFDDFQQLDDGGALVVPNGVTVMVDEGAIFKMRGSYVQVGSTTTSIDNSGAAFQILGTPDAEVIFTSRRDETIGVDTELLVTTPRPGDWGGIIFQNDLDRANNAANSDGSPRDFEARGIFMNHVSNADLRYGGGGVTIDSVQRTVNPVHMIDARPTIMYNDIFFSADAAISANPDSFEESRFHGVDSLGVDYQATPFTSTYERVGPDVQGNLLQDNTTNGLALRIDTLAGRPIERMTVSGRFDDTDIVHVVKEDLIIQATPGGPLELADGSRVARTDGQLVIDPGIIVKLNGSRIEATVGTQLIAEGNAADGQGIVFTSIDDDRFGGVTEVASGTLDKEPAPGDWGGIYVGHSGRLSIDHATIAFGGGVTRIPGSSAAFNAIELHQVQAARITNSVLEDNADGIGGIGEEYRVGRGAHDAGAIFVRGSQPVLIDNQITGTTGTATGVVNIDVNSLNAVELPDYGRSRGGLDRFELFDDNQGPLIRDNVLDGNSVNGMVVRSGVVATESVWDDTDIVHVMYGEVVIPNQFSEGGVRLESSSSESLVIKLDGNAAGFTTTGIPLEIDDRIGGVLNVVGQPGRPVVMTSLADDSVGAGLGLDGTTQTNTDEGHFTRPERTQPVGSFQIDLNFGPEIRKHDDIMAGVERAARQWERLIEDPITVTIDFELDSWAQPGNAAGRAEGTFEIGGEYTQSGGAPYLVTTEGLLVNYDEVVSRLKRDAGDHESFVDQIPNADNLDVSFPNTPENPYTLADTINLTNANYKALFGDDGGAIIATPSEFDPAEGRDGRVLINEGALGFYGTDFAPVFFDYDRSDGLQQSEYDFVGFMSQAIGRILGFKSSIEDVRLSLADTAQSRDISITPMDLFRLEPGAGNEDFQDAARALDPSQQAHVFYDGGVFDTFGLPTQFQYQMGDIPLLVDNLDAEDVNIDGTGIPTSYEHPSNLNGRYLGVGVPDMDTDIEYYITDQDRSVFDLIGYDVVGGAIAGDWRGLQFETYSHDRNVGIVNEFEDVNDRDGSNQVPSEAQVLGKIAKEELDSDENQRAGFEVHGYINNPADVDVYSFEAAPGTELWIDIDNTSQALDTIVELVDANGLTLARSDNSIDEEAGTMQRFQSPQAPTFDLSKSPFLSKDFYTTNPLDAGFRVLIPGFSNDFSTFFVRVRSSSPNPSVLNAGLTEGRYELQIRTQELDEVPGTSVEFADIRYAVDGIRVSGLPRHNILTGEAAEDDTANDTLGFTTGAPDDFLNQGYLPIRTEITAAPDDNPEDVREPTLTNAFPTPQFIGNVITSDGSAVAISGQLQAPIPDPVFDPDIEGAVDIDYYMFTVDFEAVQSTGLLPEPTQATLMFDLDYADGLGRADTSIYIFRAGFPDTLPQTEYDVYISGEEEPLDIDLDELYANIQNLAEQGIEPVFSGFVSEGALVAYSDGGNDKDDLPAPAVTDTGLDDLSRGSVGRLDPILGPITLPEGQYILMVGPSNVPVPLAVDQFNSKLPANPGIRVTPLESVGRIADESFDDVADPEPEIPVLIDDSSIVPLTLADVPLYVSTQGAGQGTEIWTVDTFQGGKETKIGTVRRPVDDDGGGGDDGPAVLEVGDIVLAERNAPLGGPDILNVEELLFGFTLGATDAESGNYLAIDAGDAFTEDLIIDNGNQQTGGGNQNDGDGDDQIVTYHITPNDDPEADRESEAIDEGVQFEALALFQNGPRAYDGYAVGSRNDPAIDNILYSYDHRTGLATPNEDADKRTDDDLVPETPEEDAIFGFSDIVERGVLITNEDLRFGQLPGSGTANADTSLIVSAATADDGSVLISDGDTFTVSDDGTETIFEFDVISDFLLAADPVNGQFLADGEQFTVNSTTYEIETGAVIVIEDMSMLLDGEVVSVGDYRSDAPIMFFELDTDGTVSEGRVGIDLSAAADETEVAALLADQINAQSAFSVTATAAGNRVSLIYDGGVVDTSPGIEIAGSQGVSAGAEAITVEEFYTSEQLAATLAAVVPGSVAVENRLTLGGNFDTISINSSVLQSAGAAAGVSTGNTAVPFTIDMDREEIAAAIAGAIGSPATPYDGVVTLQTGGQYTFTDGGNFAVEGQSPGGKITGIEFVGSRLFAVSDAGGLFEIVSYAEGAYADYLEQSAQLLGTRFSGLTIGPADVANGEYADTLFATDSAGNLHAFTTDGIPRPVFADGATSISTGVGGANGLAFSTSQNNLWSISDQRSDDTGHGGGNSLRFGDATRNIDFPGGAQGSVISNEIDLSNYTADDLPALYFNYFMTAEEAEGPVKRDAFRVFISDDSDDAAAKGTWHLLATSDESGRPFDNDPEDGIDIDVQTLWNNSYQDVISRVRDGLESFDPDEIEPANGERDAWPPQNRDEDNPPPFPPGQAQIGELSDWLAFPQLDETEGVWRQARVDLSPFAGQDSLRLRFDFSTAASFDLGNLGGIELKAVAGDKLADGDTLTVDGVTFEVEMGPSLLAPAGIGLSEGEQLFVLDDEGTSYRFEFTTDDVVDVDAVPVLYTPVDTAETVMTSLVDAINGLGTGMSAELVGTRIITSGIEVVFEDAGSLFVIDGSGANAGYDPSHVPLFVASSMTDVEVAAVLQAAFVAELGQGIDANYVAVGNVIRMFGDSVDDQGPFGLADELRGDEWGAFVTPDTDPSYRGLNNLYRYYDVDDDGEENEDQQSLTMPFIYPPDQDDQQNDPALQFTEDFAVQFEGVYVDDIIIGFRSRGEQVTDTREQHIYTAGYESPDFNATPRIPNVFAPLPEPIQQPLDIQTGEYRLEIRTTTQTAFVLNQLDRTAPNVTLLATPGVQLFDGKTFQLSDGQAIVTFEYNDLGVDDGISDSTYVPVNFSVGDSAAQVAASIRDAVNMARSLPKGDPRRLDLTATSADGSLDEGIVTTDSDRVNLFGNANVIESDDLNGINFVASGLEGSGNRERYQGQLIISQNRISNSEGHGIVVEDALRDLPSYLWSDLADTELHSQFSEGDYTPQPGPVQNLREINHENLTTGVVISNNVVAFNGEGGIKYGGDPNGYIFMAPVGGDPNQFEVWDGLKFSVTDNNGETRTFEFHDLGGGGAANPRRPGQANNPQNGDWEYGNIPILFARTDFVTPANCVLGTCEDRYAFDDVDMADRLQEAFKRADLDLTVYRGKGHEIFVEGAQEMLWRPRDTPSFARLFSFATPVTTGAVPFGRIINNTIVGIGGELTDTRVDRITPLNGAVGDGDDFRVVNDFKDVGIEVGDNADPTLLNNVIVNFETGLLVDATAVDIVREGLVFQANNRSTFNTTAGDFALSLDNDDPLFVDLLNGNFYPAANSQIIDSSIDSLEERPSLETVKSAIGIAPSPILVPDRDALGQLRQDDPAVEPQLGQGRNAFNDRGAIDRVDFVGPEAILLNPRDNDALGVDQNPTQTRVDLSPLVELENFEIEFQDSSQLGGLTDGTGVDPVSVQDVTVLQDGSALTEGVDYVLSYDATNSVLRIIPTAGNWPAGRTYQIVLDGVRDVAGNAVRDNQIGGGVNFTINTLLGTDYSDAPEEYSVASHEIRDNFFLGSSVTADAGSQADVAASGDGGDDGVILPDEFIRGEANTITVQASAAGVLDAWFDFNNNRVFDTSERVFAAAGLSAGANELSVSLPQATAGGELFARFRFSSAGVDGPGGAAADGEVEDYVISVDGGAIWQNVLNPFDVDNDGFVSPRDVLQIKQELKTSRASDPITKELDDPFEAPNTPSFIGFVDVTGDGYVTPKDVLAVVTEINRGTQASGEPPELLAALGTTVVDPIGEILQNPVVELPTTAPESLDDAFAETDWWDDLDAI